MKATLIIRNFGPISDLHIDIKKYNLLIGPQGGGKSTISKVLCVIHFFDLRTLLHTPENKREIETLHPILIHYRIENYYQNNSYWFFEDDVLKFELKDGYFSVNYKTTTPKTDCYYFPAERIALPMISESLFEVTYEQSTLPQYFLKFGRDFTIARKNQKTFNLPILDVEYEYKDNKNVVISRSGKAIFLEETSSALQANLPLLITLEYPIRDASLFVVEELELHNFPELQKKLLYYLIERMRHPRLKDAYVMLPTHSPYLLSTINNLLFCSRVMKHNRNNADAINKIIPKESWLDIDDFSAFYIEKGTGRSIIDNETELIHENELDIISEHLAEEFDALMNLYSPFLV